MTDVDGEDENFLTQKEAVAHARLLKKEALKRWDWEEWESEYITVSYITTNGSEIVTHTFSAQ